MEKWFKDGMRSVLMIYGIRCIIGFLIGYKLYLEFPEFELYWTIISILLVISPEGKDSRKLTVERVKSNLIGSSVGLLCFMLPAPEVVMMVLGIVLSILICYLFDLMNVARTAVVALIIVVIHEQETMTPFAAIERFVSVTLGCLIGLAITVSTAYLIRYMKKQAKPKVK